jgi:hypothetical protein
VPGGVSLAVAIHVGDADSRLPLLLAARHPARERALSVDGVDLLYGTSTSRSVRPSWSASWNTSALGLALNDLCSAWRRGRRTTTDHELATAILFDQRRSTGGWSACNRPTAITNGRPSSDVGGTEPPPSLGVLRDLTFAVLTKTSGAQLIPVAAASSATPVGGNAGSG